MQHDTADPHSNPLAHPPGPEEIDAAAEADPWVLRRRLTFAAYATRCRAAGREPSQAEWLDQLRLDDRELELLNDRIEAQREGHLPQIGPRFVIREYGNKARVGWFDDRGELVTMSFAEFRNAYIDMRVQVGTNKDGHPITKPLADHWLEHPLTRRYDRVEFRPGEAAPEGVLNLWHGWPHRPGWDERRLVPGGGTEPVTDGPFDGHELPAGYCDLFLDHMRTNMCDGDEELLYYLLGWMADALWNPGPCEIVVVLQGPEGSGKTLWAQEFMAFFGPHAITLDDPEQVVGGFNKHPMNKSVVFADEAFFAGNRAHAAKLRTMITPPDLFVVPKGVDGFIAPKKWRLVIASNDDHVIRAAREDRRYLVLRVDARESDQDKEYFGAMRREMDGGGRRALFRWLTGRW